MDVQLQELIDKIKKDGVASAETSAKDIVAEAEKKAASIISEAEAKAESILKNAKAETERMEKASEDAITQAGRNLIISFRDGINKELSGIVREQTAKAYDKELLKKLIPETVKSWSAEPEAKDLTVLLSPKDLKALEDNLKTALKSQIAKGLEIKSDASISAGFRVGSKDGSAFYDFSADEVADLFSAYLNPKTTQLMKNAAAGIPPEHHEIVIETDVAEEEEEEETTPKTKKPAAKKATAAKKTTTKKTTTKKGSKD